MSRRRRVVSLLDSVILQRRSVSAVHVAFEIHPETLVVLLSTRTKRTSSVVVESDDGLPEPIEGDCVLSYGTAYKIEIAGYNFGLIWRTKHPGLLRELAIQGYKQALERQALGNVRSRHLPTEVDSEAHTWDNTRIHTAQRPLAQ